MDREKFLKLSLAYAEANKIAFDGINEDNSVISKNVKLANQARKKLDKLCKESKENGTLNSVEAFMEHEDKYVRCLAAMYSLFTNPTVAEQELEKLMVLPKPNAVGAQAMTILEVWRKGLMVL